MLPFVEGEWADYARPQRTVGHAWDNAAGFLRPGFLNYLPGPAGFGLIHDPCSSRNQLIKSGNLNDPDPLPEQTGSCTAGLDQGRRPPGPAVVHPAERVTAQFPVPYHHDRRGQAPVLEQATALLAARRRGSGNGTLKPDGLAPGPWFCDQAPGSSLIKASRPGSFSGRANAPGSLGGPGCSG